MTADLNAVMTADPVTNPEEVMVPEMKDPGKVELGNLAEVEVLGVTAKSKKSNNGRQNLRKGPGAAGLTTVDPVVEMIADPVMDHPVVEMTADPVMHPGVVMTVDPGVAMTVDHPEGVMVVVEAGVMLPVRIA